MPFKVRVDHSTCIACGVCYALAPQVFTSAEDGKSIIVPEDRTREDGTEGVVPDELRSVVVQAKDSCPTGSITIEE